MTDSQKKEIITKVTDAMVSIEGENLRPVTWVVFEEVKSGDWGIGVKVIKPKMLRNSPQANDTQCKIIRMFG